MGRRMSKREYHESVRRQRLEQITREAGLTADTPPGVLADHLDERGHAELAKEVRGLDPAVRPVYSTKRRYPVGRRHEYIFYLVKDAESLEARQEAADRLCAEYHLNDEERRALAAMLEKERIHPPVRAWNPRP
jgi:hypothetical protein